MRFCAKYKKHQRRISGKVTDMLSFTSPNQSKSTEVKNNHNTRRKRRVKKKIGKQRKDIETKRNEQISHIDLVRIN